ncbi:uncharacterized protein [Dermacentor andersoni]|uniref:uncharacterized protein isoform X2 n=1 Tax=Dermacentor andersoni TaxID=34620 RepID=UPI002416951E|nr:uncharacterized protein LOC129381709 isoform X2 [Dermacentor andersoni]
MPPLHDWNKASENPVKVRTQARARSRRTLAPEKESDLALRRCPHSSRNIWRSSAAAGKVTVNMQCSRHRGSRLSTGCASTLVRGVVLESMFCTVHTLQWGV